MGKYTNTKKLNKKEQEELFIQFARCLGSIKDPEEAARFMQDLFSEQEILMLARRLQIADLLSKGFKYEEIHRLIPVGDNSIAKVALWLQLHGEGFRLVLKRANKLDTAPTPTASPGSWRAFKKKYPQYFWPQFLLEEIIRKANKRERERLRNVIDNMKEKTKLSHDLLKILK